jgi:uncharacterized protein GlcG (DUF336 family)
VHITPAQASTIVDAALARARGHLIAFKREDRSGILRFQIACLCALGMGFGSREIAGRAVGQPVLHQRPDLHERLGRLVPAQVQLSLEGANLVVVGRITDRTDHLAISIPPGR